MPMYQYKCEEHGDFERLRKISERLEAECPKCGAVCKQSVTAPRGICGGFVDRSLKVS